MPHGLRGEADLGVVRSDEGDEGCLIIRKESGSVTFSKSMPPCPGDAKVMRVNGLLGIARLTHVNYLAVVSNVTHAGNLPQGGVFQVWMHQTACPPRGYLANPTDVVVKPPAPSTAGGGLPTHGSNMGLKTVDGSWGMRISAVHENMRDLALLPDLMRRHQLMACVLLWSQVKDVVLLPLALPPADDDEDSLTDDQRTVDDRQHAILQDILSNWGMYASPSVDLTRTQQTLKGTRGKPQPPVDRCVRQPLLGFSAEASTIALCLHHWP